MKREMTVTVMVDGVAAETLGYDKGWEKDLALYEDGNILEVYHRDGSGEVSISLRDFVFAKFREVLVEYEFWMRREEMMAHDRAVFSGDKAVAA